MRLSLRNIVLTPAVLAVVALATQSAHAAASATSVNVPFSFKVDDKICPAGEYLVGTDMASRFITLQGKNSGVSFNFLSGPGDDEQPGKAVLLKFDTINDLHVLHSVQVKKSVTRELDKKLIAERISAPHSSGR